MPQQKKTASTRARANRAAGAAKLDLTKKFPVPAMPKGVSWHPQVRIWWKGVWSSPMSNEWHESDRANVVVAAMLLNDFWTATGASARKEAAAEFRQHRSSLGLTPYDRRRLEWEFRSPNDPAASAAAEAAAASADAQKSTGTEGVARPAKDPDAEDPRLTLVK
jgi:hypothetical protein